jgi:hypothetical protein
MAALQTNHHTELNEDLRTGGASLAFSGSFLGLLPNRADLIAPHPQSGWSASKRRRADAQSSVEFSKRSTDLGILRARAWIVARTGSGIAIANHRQWCCTGGSSH